MDGNARKMMGKVSSALAAAVVLTVVYILWTGSTEPTDMAVFACVSVVASALFVKGGIFPRPGIRPLAYAAAYVPYLLFEIVKANFDVASRIVRPRVPLNPGIVRAKTRLKTRIGRAALANSITLTPGTLSVEIKGDILYIHWIDVRGGGGEEEAEGIIQGFERYLEVIFG